MNRLVTDAPEEHFITSYRTQKSVIIITKRDIQTRDGLILKHDLCVCVILIADSPGSVRLKADNWSLSLNVI